MKERKNIDRLYQEKFKNFEATPGPYVWKDIARRLEEDKNRKPIILPLWYKIAGAAAVLALLLAGSLWLTNTGSPATTPEVVFEIEEITRPKIDIPWQNETLNEAGNLLQQINSKYQDSQGKISPSASQNQQALAEGEASENTRSEVNQPAEKQIQEEIGLTENHDSSEENAKQEGPTGEEKVPSQRIAENREEEITKEDETSENALAALEDEKEEREEEPSLKESKSRISLSTFAAPVFYNKMGRGNTIDPQLSNNPSNSNLTLAYGLNIAYRISDKIKIRSGIGKVSMSYDIEDVVFSAAIAPNALASIDYSNNNRNNIQILSNSRSRENLEASSSFSTMSEARPMLGEINQQFGYIEVPLEIEYSLIDKKVGLNLIGGGSSLFLDENRIQLNSYNNSSHLGEANNLNSFSFSTNIGVGMDYNFTDQFQFNLEPIFKYQINSFNNTQNVQPYFFGVYSGFSFKF